MTRQRARARARTRAARARVAALIARHEEKKFETCRSFVRSLASGPARACDAAFRGADGRLPSLERSIYMSSRRSRDLGFEVQFCVTNNLLLIIRPPTDVERKRR